MIFALSRLTRGFFVLEVIIVNCPFYNFPMEKGFLQSGNLMVWVRKKHLLSLRPKEGEVLLDENYLTGAAVPAWICKQCEKVIADYSEKIEGE